MVGEWIVQEGIVGGCIVREGNSGRICRGGEMYNIGGWIVD